jgi:hypothetical protein
MNTYISPLIKHAYVIVYSASLLFKTKGENERETNITHSLETQLSTFLSGPQLVRVSTRAYIGVHVVQKDSLARVQGQARSPATVK